MTLVTGRTTPTMSKQDCDRELRRCAKLLKDGNPEQKSRARKRADQLLDIRNDAGRVKA